VDRPVVRPGDELIDHKGPGGDFIGPVNELGEAGWELVVPHQEPREW
jgi:hypothetical protein